MGFEHGNHRTKTQKKNRLLDIFIFFPAISVQDLGKLISVHPPSAIHLQRAVFITVLSFVFFLGMMFAFYILQSFVYFLLASAFLIIYLVTMFSLFTQKRNVLKIFEHGISYRKFSSRWDEIASVTTKDDKTCEIRRNDGKTISISASLDGYDQAVQRIGAVVKSRE